MTARKATPRKTVGAKGPEGPNRATRRAGAPRAVKLAPPVEHKVKPKGTAARITDLEQKLDVMIWLHAELSYSIRLAVAKQIAAKKTKDAEQQLIQQMMSGGGGLPQ